MLKDDIAKFQEKLDELNEQLTKPVRKAIQDLHKFQYDWAPTFTVHSVNKDGLIVLDKDRNHYEDEPDSLTLNIDKIQNGSLTLNDLMFESDLQEIEEQKEKIEQEKKEYERLKAKYESA